MALETTAVRLRLERRWAFEELTDAARDYIQLYGFSYSILSDLPLVRRREVEFVYSRYPWRGGFSTINFFHQLFRRIPPELQPQIQRIQYASPGFIDLAALVEVATAVSAIVTTISGAIIIANKAYRDIQKGLTDHKLTQLDISKKEFELTRDQFSFCKSAVEELVPTLGLTKEQEILLKSRSQNNPLMMLKILMSVFRRAEALAEKQFSKKLFLDKPDS